MQQDDVPPPLRQTVVSADVHAPSKKQTPKAKLSQTSLAAYFPKVQNKEEPNQEVNEANLPITSESTPLGSRKLPPVELPATRGASKRASLQKEPTHQVDYNNNLPLSYRRKLHDPQPKQCIPYLF